MKLVTDISYKDELKAAGVYRHYSDMITLSSGIKSHHKYDVEVLGGHPDLLKKTAKMLASDIDSRINAVASTGRGGSMIAYAVAFYKNLKVTIVKEKDDPRTKDDLGCYTGLQKTDNYLIVDDVLTTGTTFHYLLKAIRAYGANVVQARAVLKRGDIFLRLKGETSDVSSIEKVPFDYLLDAEDLQK